MGAGECTADPALLMLFQYYGDSLEVECPTGSGVEKNLFEVAHEIGDRLAKIFRVDEKAEGRCTANGEVPDRSALEGLPAVL
jgi:hypothetical protein